MTDKRKTYQGKKRIYVSVPRSPGVSRLWVWDDKKAEYLPPKNGKSYFARRYRDRVREYQFFASLEETRDWQSKRDAVTAPKSIPVSQSPLFGDIIEEWRKRRYPLLALGTRMQYDKLIRLYLKPLNGLRIHELTPQKIDEWLDGLKDPNGLTRMQVTRCSFDHELTLLITILRYYQEYHDDAEFRFPVKQRHREATVLHRPLAPIAKDLHEEEFLKFREHLAAHKDGEILVALATLQYYQALRVSEAAGLFWEDVQFDWNNPRKSRIRIVRSVCYIRSKEVPSFIRSGFKNSTSNGGVKEQPMFPETFRVLQSLYRPGAKGLVFQVEGGKHLEYRSIQSHFDRAFREAGLPYSGTHVMRHGGCRRVYNQVPDTAVAQQLLGNSDLKTTLVYAKRHAGALTEVAQKFWDKDSEIGCNWLQSDQESK